MMSGEKNYDGLDESEINLTSEYRRYEYLVISISLCEKNTMKIVFEVDKLQCKIYNST